MSVETIDEKINNLIKFREEHPDVKISGHEEYPSKGKEFAEELKKIRDNYAYVRLRKSQGKLTEEQIKKCTDGDIRGVFGVAPKITDLSKKYRINVEKIDYILSKYHNIDSFVKAYREGNLTKEDLETFKDNIKYRIDIDLDESGIDRFVTEVIENTELQPINEKGIITETGIVYSSKNVREALETTYMSERTRDTLKGLYGIDEESKNLAQLAEDFKIARPNVRQLATSGLRKIRTANNLKKIFPYDELLSSENMTEETKTALNKLKDLIFDSNYIFVPDEEFKDEPCNINREEIEKVKEILNGEQEKDSIEEANDVETTKLEDLGFSTRTYNILTLPNYGNLKTVDDLLKMSDEEIKGMRAMGNNSFKEVMEKVKELREKSNTDNANEKEEKIDEVEEVKTENTESIESEKTELEKLKEEKLKLQSEVDELRVKVEKAKELLGQYERLTQDKEGRDVSED